MKDRDWLKENWKWFFPTLGSAILIVLVSSVVIGFIYISGVVKTSTLYKLSLKKAKENSLVQEKIGKSLRSGLFVSGIISVSQLSGEADFEMPISGEKGEGVLKVKAQKIDGQWVYSVLEVDVNNSKEAIDLVVKEKK